MSPIEPVAEPGADVLEHPPEVEPQPIGDISDISLAEPGAEAGVRVRLLDLNRGAELRPLAISGELDGLALGPEGRLLATVDREHVVRVWDTAEGSLVAQYAHDRRVDRLVFDPTGRWLASVDRQLTARVWPLLAAPETGARPLFSRESWDPELLVKFA